jgi:hypothetical protein
MGITHLIRSNPDIGFRHGMELARSSDPDKRAMFARIATQALRRGMTIADQNLAGSPTRRNRFCEVGCHYFDCG